jgi:hypothetical protein
MTDLATALADAAFEPRTEPDMIAARRRGRHRRYRRSGWVAVALASIAVVGTFALSRLDAHSGRAKPRVATSADDWSTFTSRTGDLEIKYPPDWQLAARVLTPHLSDPHEVLALGTFPMQAADHNCAHIPVNALEQMARTDGFIWITERTGTAEMPASNFGLRPTVIGPRTGADANQGDLSACLNHPLAGTARAISFDDHDRHFTITYALGSDVSPQRRSDLLRILNSFRVT